MNGATWVENRGNDSEHHQETMGRRKEEGLEKSQANSLSAFPLLLGPPQARDSDKATILPCLG